MYGDGYLYNVTKYPYPGFSFEAESGQTFKARIDAATVSQLSETVAMQSVDYGYNVRRWLKRIGSVLNWQV